MQEQQEKTSKETTETNGGNTVYCVEYYSDVVGSGVRKFLTPEERDDWCIRVSLDQIYLYEEEEKDDKGATS